MRTKLAVLALALSGLSFVAGCQSTGGDAAMRDSVRASSSLADVRAQIDATRAQLMKVSDSIDAMTAEGANVQAAFNSFTREVASLSASADKVRARWQDMKSRAATYMENWRKELATVSTEDVRALNAQQLEAFRADFNNLVEQARTLGEAFDPVMTRLTDLRTAMASNLSSASLSAVRPQLAATKTEIERMNNRIGEFATRLDAFASTWGPHGR